MEYNVCQICGAKDGRAGLLINDACMNCHDTRKTGEITLHTHLIRNEEEIQKTFAILDEKKEKS
jgi:hypothetical protein